MSYQTELLVDNINTYFNTSSVYLGELTTTYNELANQITRQKEDIEDLKTTYKKKTTTRDDGVKERERIKDKLADFQKTLNNVITNNRMNSMVDTTSSNGGAILKKTLGDLIDITHTAEEVFGDGAEEGAGVELAERVEVKYTFTAFGIADGDERTAATQLIRHMYQYIEFLEYYKAQIIEYNIWLKYISNVSRIMDITNAVKIYDKLRSMWGGNIQTNNETVKKRGIEVPFEFKHIRPDLHSIAQIKNTLDVINANSTLKTCEQNIDIIADILTEGKGLLHGNYVKSTKALNNLPIKTIALLNMNIIYYGLSKTTTTLNQIDISTIKYKQNGGFGDQDDPSDDYKTLTGIFTPKKND